MLSAMTGRTLALGAGTMGVEAGTKVEFKPGRFAEPPAKTILVADDDPGVRELVATVLQYRGYRVLRAADGAAGLEHLRQRPVDMLITDVDMPILDGHELAGRARAMWPDLPILFMSGSAMDRELDPHPAFRLSSFLSKPFSFSALMSEVEALLECRGAGTRRWLTAV